MIQLLYTGSPETNETQIDPSLSLGGFLSSSPVPNDFFSNLFGEITNNTIIENVQDHIVLGLITDHPVGIESLQFTLKTSRSNFGRFRVAAVKTATTDCGKIKFPTIQNQYSKPVNLTFYDCTSFYGENRINFITEPLQGDLFEVYSNNEVVAEFAYDRIIEDFTIYDDNFYLESRFDFIENKPALYLVQKDLNNFDPAIEIIRVSDGLEFGDVENFLPKQTTVLLGDVLGDEALGIYIERSISKEHIRDYKKDRTDCEKLYKLHIEKFELPTTEIVELEIEYEESETP